MTPCPLCAHADAHGYWGDSAITHCRQCHRTWPLRSRQAHCCSCHEHFSSPSAFDRHLTRLGVTPPCLRPGELLDRHGQPRLLRREDRTWAIPGDPAAIERLTSARGADAGAVSGEGPVPQTGERLGRAG